MQAIWIQGMLSKSTFYELYLYMEAGQTFPKFTDSIILLVTETSQLYCFRLNFIYSTVGLLSEGMANS